LPPTHAKTSSRDAATSACQGGAVRDRSLRIEACYDRPRLAHRVLSASSAFRPRKTVIDWAMLLANRRTGCPARLDRVTTGECVAGLAGALKGVLIASVWVLASFSALAQTNSQPQILFLHLASDANGSWRLVEQSAVPGTLKQPLASADEHGQLRVQLEDASGRALWQTRLNDPTWRRLEYPVDERSGALGVMWVRNPLAHLMIRAPFHPQARQVSIHAVALVEAQTNSLPAARLLPEPRLLGRFELRAEGR